MAKEFNLETEPELCLGMAAGKRNLSENPTLKRVNCSRENCSAIIGFSRRGHEENGVPHLVGGSPRCGNIEIEGNKIQRSLKRKFFPSPDETKDRLEERYESLINEARSLGILKEPPQSNS